MLKIVSLDIGNRNILLDLLKFLSVNFIVLIHTGFLINDSDFLYQLTSNAFFRVTIPFFFCINGYYLYNVFKTENIKSWLFKLIKIYVFWMILFAPIWFFRSSSALGFIKTVVTGFNHLWYLSALIMGGYTLYLFRNLKTKSLIILSLILYSIGLFIQYISYIYFETDNVLLNKLVLHPPFYRNFLFFAFPFLTIGYLIKREVKIEKISQNKVIVLLISSSALMFLEFLLNYYFIYEGWIINMNVAFLFIAPAIFIFGLKFKVKTSLKNWSGKFISQYATIIYLLHPAVIAILVNQLNFPFNTIPYYTLVITLILGYIITKINQKYKLPMLV